MDEIQVLIDTPYITLGQLLKEEGIIDTGGQAKWYLAEHEVVVNGENETRRGRKLYDDDKIMIQDQGMFLIMPK